ncbi:unnamed protein product [Parnassius apollo]|uniref:(apollo) hypothetical protein n=1 Tax=Parnassius apollo TaxID=110799 RepID=A0A8S3W8U0_PARAO|nr:unnamed protein product [Parnassius apollo]
MECNNGADEAQLHAEVENLRQHLAEKDAHIVGLEAEFVKCTTRANHLEEQVDTWREKYERLYDSHKRVQKLNQVLEDKLLQMIENERYKNDMNLAIQLLQCKPDNFVSQKLDNLPIDTQARVSQYVVSKTSKPSSSSQSKTVNDLETFDASEYEFNISASLMSKILEDSIQDTLTKHCDTCTCTKSQNKPFSYNEGYYSVSTQTRLSGEMKNSLCLNCNSEIKSVKSNLSMRSTSPHGIKLINEKSNIALSNMYIIPQPNSVTEINNRKTEKTVHSNIIESNVPSDEKNKMGCNLENEAIKKIEEELKQLKKNNNNGNNNMKIEPTVHHKLCERTKTSISSVKSSVHSTANEDLLIRDKAIDKEVKNQITLGETSSMRKNSQSSMGAASRTSSVAKSTVSTHKSYTQVGPGPRFCHLRMQAGSKNILLDNAEPDVPPVLYRRQSKSNENSIFKDPNDGIENFIDLVKTDVDFKSDANNENVVIESTLIDVHVDNNNKDSENPVKVSSINPILLNVSSSPLQPLKTHNFSNSSEHNNNNTQSISSQQNQLEIDNLLNDFNVGNDLQNNNTDNANDKKYNFVSSKDNQDVKIFNFDLYEQTKATQITRPLKKIDMSQLHSIENTKISKDYPPIGDLTSLDKKADSTAKQQKSSLPAIVNVYPNLTQTHLKVNENSKVFTNEQSTSSLSSDDSAAVLQKQQLLRVAEWVEKNLEQQNNFNDPLEDECSFVNRSIRRDSKLSRLTETLNELALNMPHPVSKFSKSYSNNAYNSCTSKNLINQHTTQDKGIKNTNLKLTGNIVKETIFPVESGEVTVTEINIDNSHCNINNMANYNELEDALKSTMDKEISPEDLARMEYNVKKFLLSGPHWVNPTSVGRSRRTSSKTETDV